MLVNRRLIPILAFFLVPSLAVDPVVSFPFLMLIPHHSPIILLQILLISSLHVLAIYFGVLFELGGIFLFTADVFGTPLIWSSRTIRILIGI